MKYKFALFLFLLTAALEAQTYEELKSSLEDAKKYSNEALSFNETSVDSVDYCFQMKNLNSVNHCLFRLETHITMSLENIDNAYFNIDQSLEIDDFMACSNVSNELREASKHLNETESYLGLAFDDIQSAELEHTVEGVHNILEITKEKLSSSKIELRESLFKIDQALSHIENCKH